MPKRKRTEDPDTQIKLNELIAMTVTSAPDGDELSSRIQTLQDYQENAAAGAAYIFANRTSLQGKLGMTPRLAVKRLTEGVKVLKGEIAALVAMEQARATFAARTVPKRQRGGAGAGDGRCYVNFVNVGMGDCTLIASPAGTRIMIDCGTDSTSDVILDPDFDPNTGLTPQDFIGNSIKSNTFLRGRTHVDLLLLTHPDGDHHNLIEALLSPLSATIGMVYFGGADKIETYGCSGYLKEVAGTTSGVLRKVTLCEESAVGTVTCAINDVPVRATAGPPRTLGKEFVDPATGELVVYHETVAGGDFRISILAANCTGAWKQGTYCTQDTEIKGATEPKCESTLPNKRSLVVLVECFGTKILVCGDATAITEQQVVNQFPGLLAEVNYQRMGHHGSPTSSANVFLRALSGMAAAVASTGGKTTRKNKLPKQAIIQLYPGTVPGGAVAHPIYAFESGDTTAVDYFPGLTRQVYATGSNDSYPLDLPVRTAR